MAAFISDPRPNGTGIISVEELKLHKEFIAFEGIQVSRTVRIELESLSCTWEVNSHQNPPHTNIPTPNTHSVFPRPPLVLDSKVGYGF
ncbi:hypothetical protein GBA52_010523 [Prunus armeniaca]|nr:hypothetical protein GBA52_010523 [Prunus armeniaca]